MKHITTKWLCLLLSFYTSFSMAQVNVQDSLELIRFYNDLCDGCPLVWDFSQPVETLNGVDIANNQVVEIDLDNEGLNGALADWNFSHLMVLDLDDNQLTVSILNFSFLPNLEELHLMRNSFTGSIPNFSQLPKLKELRLRESGVTGIIPDFDFLPNLLELNLGRNDLVGEVPDFYNIPLLTKLVLDRCELSGSIPNFNNLPNLDYLSLLGNDLTGSIPSFGNLSQLKQLYLSNNALTDTIPYFTNPLLERIYLNSNLLIGSIPDFTTLLNIKDIDLSYNLLSGCYPDNFNQFCDAETYDINFTENFGLPNGGDISLFCNSDLGTCDYSSQSDSLELVYFYENACSDCTFWDLEQPFNTWQGVTTNVDRRVTKLALVDMNLNGTLTDLNLSELDTIDLHNNQLSGILPFFSNLTKLVHLSLSNNLFEDEIPNYDLPELVGLYLDNNQLGHSYAYNGELVDNIPNFDKLPNLEHLSLFGNQLRGIIPNFDKLPKLKTIFLNNNILESNIPNFNLMPNLQAVMLNNNYLTGNVPNFSNQANLFLLHLYNNNLSGCFGADLQNLCSIPYLLMSGNIQLPGGGDFQSFCTNGTGLCTEIVSVSDSLELVRLYNATCNEGCSLNWDFSRPVNTWTGVLLWEGNVSSILLNDVGLSGELPDLNFSNLWILDLFDNNLTGQIPSFSYLQSLEKLYLNDNIFSGTIPDFNLPNLLTLNLNSNRIEGQLPDFNTLTNLLELRISENRVDGNIPDYSHLNNLYILEFESNNLSGEIPNFNLPNLEILDLSSNGYLTGNIPNFDSLPQLRELSLGRNILNGEIPDFQDLDSLRTLWLYSCQLSGSIPEFTNLKELETINLELNKFTGTIPEFTNNPKLTSINLSRNGLIGNIPDLSYLSNLRYLTLNKNKLQGEIPDFSSLNPFSLRIRKNYFSFEDIKDHISINPIENLSYSPQYHGNTQTRTPGIGDTIRLNLSETMPGNNDNVGYQWKKNYDEDDEINIGIDSTYTLENIQLTDIGKYTLHMTDPTRVPDLEIISEPIYVIIPGYDLLGQPVEYNQLIIQYDDLEDKADYEANQLLPNAAVLADSCSCNRLLYLYQFPNDSIAFQILLDIDTKKQSQTNAGEVDGGFNNILGIGPIPGTQGWTWADDYPDSYPDSVSIFLLDSGTDVQNWDATPYLDDAAPVDACYDIPPDSGYDYADTLTSIQGGHIDSIGHGTFGMRAIAEGSDAYMNMNIVPLKVFDKDGQGTLFNFICALYHAIDHDADIINVSAGYAGQPSDILEEAVALAYSKGQFIITATGNEGINIDSFPQYPAYYAKPFIKTKPDGTDTLIHYNNVISVATLDVMDSLWQYSNYGNQAATISAYGENMGGYAHTGDEVSYSGTSLSTYYVTRQLAAEIARDKTRNLQDIWAEFETAYLRDCPATNGLTSTGKCLDISLREVYSDLRVFLEGAFDASADTMRTDLNTLRHILPGQIDSTFDRTMATQPYDIAPFDYHGTEAVPATFYDYPPEVVDWILVSARTEIDPSSTISRTAAWLLKDGRVQLLKPLFDELDTAPDSVYIIIEHRNHMGIMSPQKLPVERNIVAWDFTNQDSYTTTTGTGQLLLNNVYWGMLAGDTNNDLDSYDINGADKGFWKNDNGAFQLYLPTDFNMNGDINGGDKIFWNANNGKFSNVPRY